MFVSDELTTEEYEKKRGCRNPCCSGCLFPTSLKFRKKRRDNNVAILVVVDVCFRRIKKLMKSDDFEGRNPCCSGCLFPTHPYDYASLK